MSIYAAVARLIQEQGPLSARDVARELRITPRAASGYIGQHKAFGHCHIGGWRRDSDGGVLYVRALYVGGPGKDAKRPPPLPEVEYQRRHRARKAVAVNSVFALGQKVDARRAAFDWRTVGAPTPDRGPACTAQPPRR